MRGLQVVPARRRGRSRPLLDVRAARLRGARGLHAAVPRPCADATSRSSSSTTTRRSSAAGCRSSTATAEVEAVEALTHDIRRLVLRLPRARLRRSSAGQYMDIAIPGADGEHRSFSMANTPGAAGSPRVHDQALRGRALLRALLRQRQRHQGRRRADVQGALRGLHAARLLAAAARVHRRRRRDGADRVAAALDGREGHASGRRPSTTARAPPTTCSRWTSSSGWPASCPT